MNLIENQFNKTEPHSVENTSGKITPSKPISILCIVVSAAMLCGGIYFIFSINIGVFFGTPASVLGFIICFTMLPSITNHHDVAWDDKGVYGPSGRTFPLFPVKKIRMNWEDIVKIDEAWSNYNFVEDHDGKRIFWGWWYHGVPAFREQLDIQMFPKF